MKVMHDDISNAPADHLYYGFVGKIEAPFDGLLQTQAYTEPSEPQRIIKDAMEKAESLGFDGVFAAVVGIPADVEDLNTELTLHVLNAWADVVEDIEKDFPDFTA